MKTITARDVDAAFAAYKHNRCQDTQDRLQAIIVAFMATLQQ